MDVYLKALEASGNLRVPFAPVVTSRLGMEFKSEIAELEQSHESADWRQKRFLFSCRDEEVWRICRISGFDQDEGICCSYSFSE